MFLNGDPVIAKYFLCGFWEVEWVVLMYIAIQCMWLFFGFLVLNQAEIFKLAQPKEDLDNLQMTRM